MTEPLRIAWLTTGRGPGSYGAFEALMRAIEDGLPVHVAVTFLNRERGEFEATDRLIDYAKGCGVPVETLSSVAFRKSRGAARSKAGEALPAWRAEYDDAVAEQLGAYDFQLGVMFGYMLIATEALHGRFTFINDHPALPDGPVGTYQEVICELIRSQACESGCMMNVVTSDVDRGPAISFCRYPLTGNGIDELWAETDTSAPREALEQTALYAEIRRRGVERERPFLVETLRAIAERRLEVPPVAAVDLTEAVERAVATDGKQWLR
jgi:folate-dependent phosphoribosylglycinamide formyltransferase PurN